MNRALFLDRDGVINEDYGYVHKIKGFHFREEIFDVCRAAKKARLKIVVVTNQAGIGRGLYTKLDYIILTEYMRSRFVSENCGLDSVYYCPYHPKYGQGHFRHDSFNRKPYPGMLVQACRDNDINPLLSLMIGDKDTDRLAANSMSIKYYVDSRSSSWKAHALEIITCM